MTDFGSPHYGASPAGPPTMPVGEAAPAPASPDRRGNLVYNVSRVVAGLAMLYAEFQGVKAIADTPVVSTSTEQVSAEVKTVDGVTLPKDTTIHVTRTEGWVWTDYDRAATGTNDKGESVAVAIGHEYGAPGKKTLQAGGLAVSAAAGLRVLAGPRRRR